MDNPYIQAEIGRIESEIKDNEALMADPTLYEDLKTIFGNVKRNLLLKRQVTI